MLRISKTILILVSLATPAMAQISGSGFPPSSQACSASLVNQTYVDYTNNLTYKCVNISGVGYVWQLPQSPVLPVTSAPSGSCTAAQWPGRFQ